MPLLFLDSKLSADGHIQRHPTEQLTEHPTEHPTEQPVEQPVEQEIEQLVDLLCPTSDSFLPWAILAAVAESDSTASILPSFSNDCFAAEKANWGLS
jgi:hypothetical protein